MKNKTFLLLLALGVLIFLIDRKTGVFAPVRGVTQRIFLPLQYGFFHLENGLNDQFRVVTFWRSGEARIKNLEQRNLELLGKFGQLESLTAENQVLREQLEVAPKLKLSLVAASVIGKTDRWQIDRGTADAIAVGQAVIAREVLVGTVDQVSPHSAFVLLPTDPRSKIPARIGKSAGIVLGQFGTGVILDKVAQTEPLSTGDIVLTSGDGQAFPANLYIGFVREILGTTSDVFKKAEIERPVSIDKVQTVFVVTGYD